MAGSRSAFFSLEINHGGFFVGSGSNKSYVDGHVIYYDEVDTLTWSPLMLERIVEEIGYEMQGRIKVYYCIPILTMQNNGLRQVRSDHDTQQMCTFVDIGHHYFSIYLEHDPSNSAAMTWDDVVHYPIASLPTVISPSKPCNSRNHMTQVDETVPFHIQTEGSEALVPLQVIYPTREDRYHDNVAGRTRQSKRKIMSSDPEGIAQLSESESDEEEEDSEFDCGESDNDVGDGDDDLYQANVDEDSEDDNCQSSKGKAKRSASGKGKQTIHMKEENSEEEDLWGPDSDDENVQLKFRTFREDDLNDPKFHVGQVFGSVDLLRKAIRAYSCIHRKDIKLPINDLKRVRGKCGKDCPWYLWASKDLKRAYMQW
jgi:hypothetical protein